MAGVELQRPQLNDAETAALSILKSKWQADGSHDVFMPKERSLPEYIAHFDENWRQEGLPQDWYNLNKKVGFSMNMQMALLQDTAQSSVALWAEQTKRDALGFCLEYLSGRLVYPFRYQKQQMPGGSWGLVDPKYHKEMMAMVSSKERGGAVVNSLAKIKEFFLNPDTQDGAIAIMPSPLGPTGLTTDDGKPISYPDSHWFVFMKDGDDVIGCTIKTDFNLEECRLAIRGFTKKELPDNATLADYNLAIALIKPWDTPWPYYLTPTEGIIDILKKSRSSNSEFAFKDKSWTEVAQDMQRGDELYEFNQKTQNMVKEFVEYVTSKNFTRLELRKALGATMLRLSKLFLIEDRQTAELGTKSSGGTAEYREQSFDSVPYVTFGAVLEKVEEIPGCAGGGGSSTSVESIISRLGNTTSGEGTRILCCTCPFCKEQVEAKISNGTITCPNCGRSATWTDSN